MAYTLPYTTVGLVAVQLFLCALQVSSQFINPNGCPSISTCTLQCTNGYIQDSNGCDVCTCADGTGSGSQGAKSMYSDGDPFNEGGVFSPMGGVSNNRPTASTLYYSPCDNETSCELTCDNGFIYGPDGCQFCSCASLTSSSDTYNPCPDAAPTCDAVCPYGLVTDSTYGCHRCACIETIPEVTTTQRPPTTTLSPEECIMKNTECQIKYPFGFMTDDSCTMCISKDDIYPPYIPEERQPLIRLNNPCVQGFDMCRIFCKTGYRTGPRQCQYCACNG